MTANEESVLLILPVSSAVIVIALSIFFETSMALGSLVIPYRGSAVQVNPAYCSPASEGAVNEPQNQRAKNAIMVRHIIQEPWRP